MKYYGKETVSINVCCAVIAGAVSSAIANPTDVIKVRMQVSGSENGGLIACFKDVYTHEGISGLWRVIKLLYYFFNLFKIFMCRV